MDVLKLTEQILNRFVLADFLPVYAHDQGRNLYVLSHGVGFVYEISQVWGGSSTVTPLKGLYYEELPPGTAIQYFVWASPTVSYLMDSYVHLREKNSPLPELIRFAENRKKFIEAGTSRSILRGYDFRVRRFRHLVTCIVPCDSTPSGYEAGLDLAHRIKMTVFQALHAAHLSPEEVYPARLIAILSELLNPGHPHDEMPRYDEKTVIRDQVCDYDTELIVEKDYLLLDGMYVRTLTVRQYPDEWDISDTVNYVGSLFDNVRQIPVNFFITFNTEFPDKVKTIASVQQKQITTSYQLFGPLARWFPELADKKAGLDRYLAAVKKGDSPVYAYMTMVLYARSMEELESATSLASNLMRSLGFIMQTDNYIMFPVFLQALPFGYSSDAQPDLRRRKLMKASDVAELAPLASDWPGFGPPVIQLVSRRGQLQFFDVFANPQGGYSGIVVASTGAGKSFFVNELIISYLSCGAKIWVIDVGRSYEKLCNFCGGTFMVFGPESRICINPFSTVRDINEEMPILKSIVAQMVSMTALDELSMAYIEEAIKEMFMRKQNDMTITDVAAYLEREKGQEPIALSIAKRLYPYTVNGAYANYFNGAYNLKAETDLIVVELEELKSKKDLQEVVLLSLIFQIQQAMVDRETYKLLIIDEAWDLLTGGNTTQFMETAYRRFRKYRGACFTITQSVNDFYRIPAGLAIVENADFMFLLRQRPESIRMLKESGRVSLTEGLYELLESVHTDQGNYSEIFVYTPVGATVSRLIVDRFTQLLYTSKADEFAAIKRYMDRGLSVVEAIEKVMEEERT
jgi:conjugal transfer ATP-binding protein TraC